MLQRSIIRGRGFTLIELLVVIALLVIVLAVGIPSFRDYIVLNRLKAVNAQLVADLQFARAEAAARNMPVYWTYRTGGSGSSSFTCYTIYTAKVDGTECDCGLGPGSACGSDPNMKELRVVQVPISGKVRLAIASTDKDSIGFDNVSGGIYYGTTDFAAANLSDFLIKTAVFGDSTRTLNTFISPAGRPTVCSAGSTRIQGYPQCP